MVLWGLSLPANAEVYANPFAGMTVFDSTVTVGGTKLIDQGGDAVIGGVRLGIQSEGSFLYGAELEAFGGTGRSRAIVNGETYSVNLDYGVGAYARIGWRTRGQALGFFRIGVLNTNIDTRVDFGAGAEIPISNRMRFRIDLGYAPGDIEFYRLTGGIVIAF